MKIQWFEDSIIIQSKLFLMESENIIRIQTIIIHCPPTESIDDNWIHETYFDIKFNTPSISFMDFGEKCRIALTTSEYKHNAISFEFFRPHYGYKCQEYFETYGNIPLTDIHEFTLRVFVSEEM